MRKDLKNNNYFFPLPVLIVGTYDDKGVPNAMTAAWGGQFDTNQVIVCLSDKRLTSENVLQSKAFTLSFANKDNVDLSDYLGLVSGHNENKIDKANIKTFKAKFVNAPIFIDFPVALECKLINTLKAKGTLWIIGEVMNVSCDESILIDGMIDIKKLNPIIFDPSKNGYYSIGEKIADAFKVGEKIK